MLTANLSRAGVPYEVIRDGIEGLPQALVTELREAFDDERKSVFFIAGDEILTKQKALLYGAVYHMVRGNRWRLGYLTTSLLEDDSFSQGDYDVFLVRHATLLSRRAQWKFKDLLTEAIEQKKPIIIGVDTVDAFAKIYGVEYTNLLAQHTRGVTVEERE